MKTLLWPKLRMIQTIFMFKFSIVKSDIGPLLDSSGNLTSDKKIICKLLLDQFNKIFSTPNVENRVNDPVSYFTSEMGSLTPQLSNITIDKNKIIEAIHDLSTHSAPGPDGVPAIVFKECAEALSQPLMILFNSFFDCHYIPDILKRAAIVPVYKSGEKSNPINYRPISLTPILMKILERIVRKQVVQFLTDNNFLNSTQHGFREGRSCLSALLNVYDDIVHMISDPSAVVDMIYLDFAKAFDKVDHGILLRKLREIGISGNLGIWFYNFLAHRSQYVRLPGGVSDDSMVISGVPQGTVLGPMLFLVLMSDINQNIEVSKIISFADDTRLYTPIYSVDDCDSLQSDLQSVYDWAHSNNMVFNSGKFNHLCFSASSDMSVCSNAYISPEMNLIAQHEHIKDLGVFMSADCSFDHHISVISKKCSSIAGWILRTFTSRDRTPMLTLFKSIVLSRLDFGCQLWSPHQAKHINSIEKVQRSFTKHISGMYSLSYSERLTSLNLYSVQRRRERYIIIYVWKMLESKVLNFNPPIITLWNERRGRMCVESHVASGHLGSICYNSFRWKAARLFNNMPKNIRNLTVCSTLCFKKKLDLHLSTIPDLPNTPNLSNSLDNKYKL